ncbi:hypothetical protein DY000_02002538 [Brassica cretica]|uniref:Peroxisomal membrane protein PEX16 n=1 Tax=Brassica cretica TaxID=69181 RepID=A0ABQ7C590_BRACR|nr:hypothetical protein DY000_02002538 [Brassica cretica]
MEAYKQWVWRNREYVHSLGSLANGLTWLLPEKFSASEIGPEAVTAFLGIFTTINQHIIETVPTTRAHVGPSGTDSSLLSYPLLISILKDLETVVEVAAEHFYGDRKWNFIIATEAINHAIAASLNVVQTSHSYGDLMLLNKASELKLENPSNYMVEMAKVESVFHVSNSEAVRYLETFSSMNPDSSGRVALHDFLRVLKLKPCTLSTEIFEFIDVEKVGSINFRQFQ